MKNSKMKLLINHLDSDIDIKQVYGKRQKNGNVRVKK